MLEIPAAVFYVATMAMVVVCVFIVVLLFYLIKAVRLALGFAEFIETKGRRLQGRYERLRRAFRIASVLWGFRLADKKTRL